MNVIYLLENEMEMSYNKVNHSLNREGAWMR